MELSEIKKGLDSEAGRAMKEYLIEKCEELRDIFNVDEKVIDIKVSHWYGDSKMEQYLRPLTLFGTKFEVYINQKPVNNPKCAKQDDSSEWQKKNQERNEKIFAQCEPADQKEFEDIEKYG